MRAHDPKDLSEELQAFVKQGKAHLANLKGNQELDGLMQALSGRYIPVKTGGDPIRHPDSLPTGTNLYGFDPSRLPVKAAYEQGTELV